MTNTNQKPSFSIIIPSLNEEKCLPRLLNDLAKQSFENFEVIVVDGESEDKTVAKAKKFVQDLNLKIVSSTKRSVSFQRNFGATQAKSDWIIFMDADNRLPSYFLQGIKYQLEKNKDTDAFTCWIKVNEYSPLYKPTIQFLNLGFSILGSESFGALIGIKKNIFFKLKFDEKQIFEDVDLVKRLVHQHYIFRCFQEPAYIYSLRRIEKEGFIHMAKTATEGRLKMLFNKTLRDFDKYPMLGGSFYEQDRQSKLSRQLEKIEQYFSQASKKQLDYAKKIWGKIVDEN